MHRGGMDSAFLFPRILLSVLAESGRPRCRVHGSCGGTWLWRDMRVRRGPRKGTEQGWDSVNSARRTRGGLVSSSSSLSGSLDSALVGAELGPNLSGFSREVHGRKPAGHPPWPSQQAAQVLTSRPG
jgi:hypothetical protein